jgi:hypothetical protein
MHQLKENVMTRELKAPEQIVDADLNEIEAGSFSSDAVGWVAFNPQPEPPASPIETSGFSATDDLEARGFNPQPEPPAKLLFGF